MNIICMDLDMSLNEQIELFKKEHRWNAEYLVEGYHLDVMRQVLEEINRRVWDQSQLAERMDISEHELTCLYIEREHITLEMLAKLAPR